MKFMLFGDPSLVLPETGGPTRNSSSCGEGRLWFKSAGPHFEVSSTATTLTMQQDVKHINPPAFLTPSYFVEAL